MANVNKKTEEISSGKPPRPQNKIPRKLRGKFNTFAKTLEFKKSKWDITFENQIKQIKLMGNACKSLKDKFKTVTQNQEKQIHDLKTQLQSSEMSLDTKAKQVDSLMELIERLTEERAEVAARLESQEELNDFLYEKLAANDENAAKLFQNEMGKGASEQKALGARKEVQLGEAQKNN